MSQNRAQSPPKPVHDRPVPPLPLLLIGAAAIVAAVLLSGRPDLDAPWLQGDEHIFIASNPDVTGEGTNRPLWQRLVSLFVHPHEDLYQPLTILTYAIEWPLWGDRRIPYMRQTDVLLHAVNALLLWAVLEAMFFRFVPVPADVRTAVAWSLALIWAAHPVLVNTYVADMGRTHLLSGAFALLALLLHLRALDHPEGRVRSRWFDAALLALLAAMLNKPVVGWVAVVLVLEGLRLGWSAAIRSPRVYVVGGLCAVFALLTLWTTRRSLLLDESPLPLFGDPFSRAALSLVLSLRNTLLPGAWLSVWYPPDIRTGWTYWAVWLGVMLLAAAAVLAARCARRREYGGVTLGLVWFLALWLPSSGIVGARVLATQDRYLYQPLMGLALAAGVGLASWVVANPRQRVRKLAGMVAVATVLATCAVPWNTQLTRQFRSTLQRALRAVRLNPGDPRAMEMLAAAYNFCQDHPTHQAHPPSPPDYRALFLAALNEAARLAAEHPEYFRNTHDRAAFHRRLSFEFWNAREFELSLREALAAAEFEPDAPLTWLRLAHGYRALGRLEETAQCYRRLEQVLTPRAPDFAIRMTEFGDLLLTGFDNPAEARPRFRAALAAPQLPRAVAVLATLGLARCEVLAGEGRAGFELANQVLARDPDNLDAQLVRALYHLLSHHWEEARAAYSAVLDRDSTQYEALRGLHEIAAQLDQWDIAVSAWAAACRAAPDRRELRSFLVWVLACADDPAAEPEADALLEEDSDNPLACYARMLTALRRGEVEAAIEWSCRAEFGRPILKARESARAEATIRLMLERGQLEPDGAVVQVTLLKRMGQTGRAKELAESYLSRNPDSTWRAYLMGLITTPPAESDARSDAQWRKTGGLSITSVESVKDSVILHSG